MKSFTKLDDAIGIERTTPEIRNGALAARLHKELNHHFWVSLLLMKCRGLNFQEPGGEE